MHVAANAATEWHGAHVQIGLKLCALAGYDTRKVRLTCQNVPSYGAWPQQPWVAAT